MTKNLPRCGKKTPTSLSLSETFVFNFEKNTVICVDFLRLSQHKQPFVARQGENREGQRKIARDRERGRHQERESSAIILNTYISSGSNLCKSAQNAKPSLHEEFKLRTLTPL